MSYEAGVGGMGCSSRGVVMVRDKEADGVSDFFLYFSNLQLPS